MRHQPPWAKDTKKYKEQGYAADYVAWEKWIVTQDETIMDDIIDLGTRAQLYSCFCACFPDYSWKLP